jgi:hypothetical protein
MSVHQAVAVTAAGGFGVVVAFQVALALGAPWGAAAWGGTTHGPLPANLRIASAVAGTVWAVAAVIVLRRAGCHVVALPTGLAWWGTWILVGVLAVGAVMNLASAVHPRPRRALPRGGAHARHDLTGIVPHRRSPRRTGRR